MVMASVETYDFLGSFLSALKLVVAAWLKTLLKCAKCWSMGV